MAESVILIPIPRADPIVTKWRKKYDEVALHGIPPHITLLFPFKDPTEIDEEIMSKLQEIFSKVKKFPFSLNEINTFPGVIFLEPSNRELFIHITEEIVKVFPENPPYGGKYPSINPHLTLGQLTKFQDIEKIKEEIIHDIKEKLPINAIAEESWLMENENGEWSTKVRFPFLEI